MNFTVQFITDSIATEGFLFSWGEEFQGSVAELRPTAICDISLQQALISF